MIDTEHPLPITRQCHILQLSRASLFYAPVLVSDNDRELIRLIDEIHLKEAYLGSRGMRNVLRMRNHKVGRIHVRTLMRKMFKYGPPDIFNTDQGSQFTSAGILKAHGVTISMDGQGRWRDNIVIERLWKTPKYQEIYLKAYESISNAKKGLTKFFDQYNTRQPHQGLGDRIPNDVYWTMLPKVKDAA